MHRERFLYSRLFDNNSDNHDNDNSINNSDNNEAKASNTTTATIRARRPQQARTTATASTNDSGNSSNSRERARSLGTPHARVLLAALAGAAAHLGELVLLRLSALRRDLLLALALLAHAPLLRLLAALLRLQLQQQLLFVRPQVRDPAARPAPACQMGAEQRGAAAYSRILLQLRLAPGLQLLQLGLRGLGLLDLPL